MVRLAPDPESRDSGFDASYRPGMTEDQSQSLRLVAAFLAAGLEQEPGAAFGFVDEGFEQSGSAGILVVITELVSLSHRGRDVLVVFHQFAQHIAGRDIALIIVLD